MKKSILSTFLVVLGTLILVNALIYLFISGEGFLDLMQDVTRHLYSFWILLSIAAVLALIFTVFNYVENAKIQDDFEQDVQKLVNQQEPKDEQLQKIYHRMTEMSAELQELSSQKSADKAEIIETERKRISRELHDSVSQELFAATMILSSVTSSSNLTNEQILTQSNLTLKILHEAQSEMRALLLHLRPIELDGKTLTSGLSALTDELQAKISANINVKLSEIHASNNIEDNLFRMAQEILSNTLRHAQAENIEVLLIERNENIILRITDDGVGFDIADEKSASYGLVNIKERAFLLGGFAEIKSAPNQGTTVEIRIPKNGKN